MQPKTESAIAIVAALFVVLSAMWDPRVSVVISVGVLGALGVYKFIQARK